MKRLALVVVVVALLGYVGVLSAESAQLRPARVVDAVADTSNLATGTAAYFQDELDPASTRPTLNLVRSTAVTSTTAAPASVTTSTSSIVRTPPAAVTSTPEVPTTTSEASTTTQVATTPPPPSIRDRGETALASYTYDWQAGLSGWEISFHPGRKGILGYTFVQEKKIEVYVRSEMSDSLLAHVIAHEIGHAIDVSKNTGDDRRRWQELRDISGKPWWPGSGDTDFSTGAGDFAESFAAWQVGNASFRSKLGSAPNAAAKALMAELAN